MVVVVVVVVVVVGYCGECKWFFFLLVVGVVLIYCWFRIN